MQKKIASVFGSLILILCIVLSGTETNAVNTVTQLKNLSSVSAETMALVQKLVLNGLASGGSYTYSYLYQNTGSSK